MRNYDEETISQTVPTSTSHDFFLCLHSFLPISDDELNTTHNTKNKEDPFVRRTCYFIMANQEDKKPKLLLLEKHRYEVKVVTTDRGPHKRD